MALYKYVDNGLGGKYRVKVEQTLRSKMGEGTFNSIKSLPKQDRRAALEKANAAVSGPEPKRVIRSGYKNRNLDSLPKKRINPDLDFQSKPIQLGPKNAAFYDGEIGDIVNVRENATNRYGDVIGTEPYPDVDYGRRQANQFICKGYPGAPKGGPGKFQRGRSTAGCHKALVAPDKGNIQKDFNLDKYNTDPDVGTGRSRMLAEKRCAKIQKRISKRKSANNKTRLDKIVSALWKSGKVSNRADMFNTLIKLGGYSKVQISMACAKLPC